VKDLLEEYLPRLYGFALRLTNDRHRAEDLTQEAFLRAWKRRRQLRNVDLVRTWLFRIAANLWKDELRRPARFENAADSINRDISDTTEPADCAVEEPDELNRARPAMIGLPNRQREVLYLVAIEQCSIAEVGEILQITSNSVKSNLSQVCRRMRELLGQQCENR